MEPQTSVATRDYALGYTSTEHDRLIRQAALLAPLTEHFLRGACIGPGLRVLDLGSGVGDVSMLAARLVGPLGEVVGVDRDEGSIARATARVTSAGLRNVSFIHAEVSQIEGPSTFDAAVGRFILMFHPEPVSVLRTLCRLVRPGGVIAFQEPSWKPYLASVAHLPLTFNVLSAVQETFVRAGADTEMGMALYRIFQEAGLTPPVMHMEVALGSNAEFIQLIPDLFASLQPLAQFHGVPVEMLGDINTLAARIHAEVVESKTVFSYVPLVGAWSKTGLAV